MTIKPILLLDTNALRHLDHLTLGRRTLVEYLLSAFELRVGSEVYAEIRRHARRMALADFLGKKKAEWKVAHCLTDQCLRELLVDLPDTPDWYPHTSLYPVNEAHLFSTAGNVGERDLFLLFLEMSYSGRTPIFLSDDLRARRLALEDLLTWKVRTGVLWITLDLVIYITMTGLVRVQGRTRRNMFFLREVRDVIRDLVLRISADGRLQQQLLTHYFALAEMIFNLVDSNSAFTELERKYDQIKYR